MRLKILYCFGLVLSISASIPLLLSSSACASCGSEELYLGRFSVASVGLGTYLLALGAGVAFFSSRWVVAFVALTVGAHAALLTLFPYHHCPYCLVAFLGELLALIAICGNQAQFQIAPIFFISGGLLAMSGITHASHLVVLESPQVRLIADALNADPTFDRSYINVVAFESPTCGLCRAFNSQYEPRLIRDSNRPLRFFHKTSTALTAFPVIIIVGQQNAVYMGLPPYEKLLADIKNL